MNTQTDHIGMKGRSCPSVSKYCLSSGIEWMLTYLFDLVEN